VFDKAAAVGMLQIENIVGGPMQVHRDKGYLLEQRVKGVAYDSPGAYPPFAASSAIAS
jgi:hypothetical protein